MAGLCHSEVLCTTSKDGTVKMWDMTCSMHKFKLEGMVRSHEAYLQHQHQVMENTKQQRRKDRHLTLADKRRLSAEESRTLDSHFKAIEIAEDAKVGLTHDEHGPCLPAEMPTPLVTPTVVASGVTSGAKSKGWHAKAGGSVLGGRREEVKPEEQGSWWPLGIATKSGTQGKGSGEKWSLTLPALW